MDDSDGKSQDISFLGDQGRTSLKGSRRTKGFRGGNPKKNRWDWKIIWYADNCGEKTKMLLEMFAVS